ncbi:hypothetical protein [Paenibacillus sp. BC26]|uniref:hypothetical protein n=1 Tax=Paenibacillus sp. BC26 TaxID=1881032 RepID=UPI0008EF1FD0|nr:hypothetical protein [Paenibacillus sp. BC26]SFS67649.1 hypothetical protein SAMN05428962_2095 [Paenibacillus sp. BC26]
MKNKFIMVISLVVILSVLSGCSKNDSILIDKIQQAFPNHVQNDEVYHTEINKNGLLVFYRHNEGLGVGFIKPKSENWEWVDGTGYSRLNPDDGLSAIYSNMDTIPLYFSYGVITDPNIYVVHSSGIKAKIIQVPDGTRIWYITYENLIGSPLPSIIGESKEGNKIITIGD